MPKYSSFFKIEIKYTFINQFIFTINPEYKNIIRIFYNIGAIFIPIFFIISILIFYILFIKEFVMTTKYTCNLLKYHLVYFSNK